MCSPNSYNICCGLYELFAEIQKKSSAIKNILPVQKKMDTYIKNEFSNTTSCFIFFCCCCFKLI